ncbi:MAG: hypothetical protein U1D30_13145 [Planctomycetota bacterium]
MLRQWLDRLRGDKRPQGRRFEPLFELEEFDKLWELPIVRVLAFTGDDERTGEGHFGPGVGGVLASLLRRDLGFTKQCSVLGGEDTGYLGPNGNDADDAQLLAFCGDSMYVVVGKVTREENSTLKVRIRVIRRDAPPGYEGKFAVRSTKDQLPMLMPSVAANVCKRLGFSVTDAVARRWRQHGITNLKDLLRTAVCWENKDTASLVKLVEAGKTHPDGVVPIDTENPKFRKASRWALSKANELEPDNAQLAFITFCAVCNFNEESVPPHFETMLRKGLASTPGHGKSHMVLPHVLDRIPENIPYILAHSETGYRFLRGNSFALSNFSRYLTRFSPKDRRILPLFLEAIEFDRQNPSAYEIAIDFFLSQKQPEQALPFAEELLALCRPPVSERTMYCFRQAPAIAEAIDRGDFDPLKHAQDLANTAKPSCRKQ